MKKSLLVLSLLLLSSVAHADRVQDLNQALSERQAAFEQASQLSDPIKRASMHREAREVFVQQTNQLLPKTRQQSMFKRFFRFFR